MKIQPYVQKLNNSQEYKEFKDKYSDAFLVAGFFVLDFEQGQNIHQIDFYIPSKKKFAAFTLDEGVNMQILDAAMDKVPEKLDMKTNIDLDALHGILEDEMKNRNMTEEIKKIIAVIQNIKGKKVWNVNCVLSGMEILKAHVEDESETVLKMEKTSFMEIMKKVPMEQMKAAKAAPVAVAPSEETEEEEGGAEAEDQASAQIKNLDILEEKILKEKQRLKSQIAEKAAKAGSKVKTAKKAKSNA